MSKRLLALDVFRGITITVMILVNSPGNNSPYAWLRHSTWNGCTLADLVFPFFLVIVGLSSVMALAKFKTNEANKRLVFLKIVKRTVYLFMMGLVLNAFPHHFDFSSIRILGVLQRIALCYFVSAILFLMTSARTQVIILGLVLIGYWLLLTGFSSVYPLTIDGNLVGYLDKLLLTSYHMYTKTFDPEGILSTLPAIATVLIGNILGVFLLSKTSKKQLLQGMIVGGLLLSTLGLVVGFQFPINKSLWSSSYVLWTGGISLLVFAVCYFMIEIKQWRYWSKPFALFGKNAMLIYMLHVLFLKIQAIILLPNQEGNLVNLRLYISDWLFGTLSLKNASLCYAITYTLFWLLVLKVIEQCRILQPKQISRAI